MAAGGSANDERLFELIRNKQDPATFAHFFAEVGDALSPQTLADAAALLINYKYRHPGGEEEQIDILRQFFAKSLDPNAKTSRNIPLLVAAILKSNRALMNELIRAGADINREVDGRWPIMEALAMGRPEIITDLLAHGADIKTPQVQGRTFAQFLQNGEYPQWGEFAVPLAPYMQAGRATLIEGLREMAHERLSQVDRNTKKLLQVREIAKKRGLPENVESGPLKSLLNLETRAPGISVQNAQQLLAALTRYEQSQAADGGRAEEGSSGGAKGGARRKTRRGRGRRRQSKRRVGSRT